MILLKCSGVSAHGMGFKVGRGLESPSLRLASALAIAHLVKIQQSCTHRRYVFCRGMSVPEVGGLPFGVVVWRVGWEFFWLKLSLKLDGFYSRAANRQDNLAQLPLVSKE